MCCIFSGAGFVCRNLVKLNFAKTGLKSKFDVVFFLMSYVCTQRDSLQRQRDKGVKGWESGGRGIVPGALLKLPVKGELPHSREVPVNAKKWQLKPLSLRRKKVTAEKYQYTRKNGSWNPREEITAGEHQPARKVGSWKPRGERLANTAIVSRL